MNPTELAERLLHLGPEWNNLELTLMDMDQERAIDSGAQKHHARQAESYKLSDQFPGEEWRVYASVETPRGPYPQGLSWKPHTIIMTVDAHSYLKEEQRALWQGFHEHITERAFTLIEEGYTLRSLKALKNQKDDFPGTVDAEETLELYASIE